MNTVDEILDYAIDQEQQAADFYEDVAQRAETAGMKKILMDFSEEEKRHKKILLDVKAGEHELIAIFTGKGPNGREYRRGANHVLTKSLGARFVELKIVDNDSSEQPDFSIREWE